MSDDPSCLEQMCSSCRKEVDDLRSEIKQLRQRTSPATEPCACPEFCTYHARSNFEDMRKKFFEIVGIMQGSGVDKEVFDKVYRIAKEGLKG